jgi:hypothetical protein
LIRLQAVDNNRARISRAYFIITSKLLSDLKTTIPIEGGETTIVTARGYMD